MRAMGTKAVARLERSDNRDRVARDNPGFASLKPGYLLFRPAGYVLNSK